MKTTYRMTLSDGTNCQEEAYSAAEAINAARWNHRGRTVIECHSGMTVTEAHNFNLIDKDRKAMPGVVAFEIPEHEPISLDAVKPRRARLVDTTESMFSDEEVKGGRLSS